MRFAVEQWAPEYGSPGGDDPLGGGLDDSSVSVEPWVERDAGGWRPIAAGPGAPRYDEVLLVDGVRRVDANVWIAAADGSSGQALCASYAAGAVRCRGTAATVEDARTARGLFATDPGAAPIDTAHGTYALHLAPRADPDLLTLTLQDCMSTLEGAVARDAPPAEVVVVDGPLKAGRDEPGVVGFVKTHRVAYGPALVRETVAHLGPGERTPVMLVASRGNRFTWYQRLPCEIAHGWAGVVRLETGASGPVDDAVLLADRLCPTLSRLASAPVKDGRAPQNLYPIGGLERALRRRLGDPLLLLRGLQAAARRAATAA